MVKRIKEAGSDKTFYKVSAERKEGMTGRNTSFFCDCMVQSPS